MIEVLSSWAKGIGVTIVIISIFEMILPNNNSKKYIRMVLGVYLIFNIISPLVTNKEVFNIDNIDLEEVATTTTSSADVNQTSMNLRIKNLYEEELEKDITKKLKDKGYEVTTCKVTTQISTKKDEETKINKIKVKINKPLKENTKEESTENKIVSEIQKIKKVDTTIKKDEDKENEKNEENSKNDKKENKKITRCRYSKCEEIFNR